MWLNQKGYMETGYFFKFRHSFICQGTSTRKQRRDFFGLRVKLPFWWPSWQGRRQKIFKGRGGRQRKTKTEK